MFIWKNTERKAKSHHWRRTNAVRRRLCFKTAVNLDTLRISLYTTNLKMKTIFKNRMRREIYLEIILNEAKSYIKECRYCDTRGDESKNKITPYRLVTVFFEHDNEYRAILNIVNNELECGFTDIVVSESHTIKLDRPICGSI